MAEHDHPYDDDELYDADELVHVDDTGLACFADAGEPGDWELKPSQDISASMIDLEKIPRRLWKETLAPMRHAERFLPIRKIRDEQLRSEAAELAFQLFLEAGDRENARLEARHRARRTGAPLPTPGADHPVRRSTVQLNIRLRADDHARLAEAAAAVGLPPTTLARALVLNGAAQVLRAPRA